ncbi:laminin-type epidermal growth factor [Pompano iridovirus]|uniref:Laminin-type epidermal growth factor n=1 Tax=Pompano iridovirus TaxID=2494350 RepID=A0A3S5HRD5_ISKNV|nr:laminin-type epidermal growth factor [Pompano iridovirus]AZQ21015.1 laminin-type epidermal growth factor [Pompano iridovirus]
MATLLLLLLLTVACTHATTFYNLEIDNQTTTLSCGVPRETDVKIVWSSDSNSLLAEHVVHGEVVHVGRNSSEVLKHGVVLYDGTILSVIKLKPHPVQTVTCHASRISSDSQPCVGVSCELPTDTDNVTPPPTLLDDGGSGMDDYDDIDEPECLSGNCSDCINVVRYTNGSLECLDDKLCVPGEMPYNMLQCYQSNVTCHCDNGLCRVSYDGTDVCCPVGYYGDPISCQQCPCPEDGPCEIHMGRLVCTSCPPGHIGDTCNRCLDGYYQAKDGVCRECQCPFNSPCTLENGTATCVCPIGHTGQRCEVCESGYFWTGHQCIRCPCDGHCTLQHDGQVICYRCVDCVGEGPCHVDMTNKNSIYCVDCPYGSSGQYCEMCDVGFFRGSNGCRPCPCPNNGACRQAGNNIICTGCPINTTKNNLCEECLDGSFGDPSGLLGPVRPCRRCHCSGNTDDNPVGQCHPETGECMRCLHNTDGFFCDRCARGYYGNALSSDPNKCKQCVCSGHGSLHPICDVYTGQCVCKPNVVGLQCDTCLPGYYGLYHDGICKPCQCHPAGTQMCDSQTGQCVCHTGVYGEACDQCMPGYFNIQAGCEACMCHPNQSISQQCDQDGQCICKEGFTGLMCTVAIPLPTEAEPEEPEEEEDEYDCPEYEDDTTTSAPPTTMPPPKRECKKKTTTTVAPTTTTTTVAPTEPEPEEPEEEEDEYDCPEYEDITSAPPTTMPPPKTACKKKTTTTVATTTTTVAPTTTTTTVAPTTTTTTTVAPTEPEPEEPEEEEDEYDCPEYEDITSAPPTTMPPPKRECKKKTTTTVATTTTTTVAPTEPEPEEPEEEEDEYDCPEYEDITSAPPTTTPPPKTACKKKPKPPMGATPVHDPQTPPPRKPEPVAPAGRPMPETEAPQRDVPIVAVVHTPERAPPQKPSQTQAPQHDAPIVAVVHTPERAPPPSQTEAPKHKVPVATVVHTPERAPPAAPSRIPPAIQNEVPVVKQSTGEEDDDDVHLGDIGGMKKGGLLMGIVIGSCMVAAAFIMFAIIGHLFFRFTRCGQYDVTTTEP